MELGNTREWELRTGRKLAGLRGDTRDNLDRLLMTTLQGTGIGRSAFIKAAIDLVESMDEHDLSSFVLSASAHERDLAVTAPYAQGM